MKKSSKPKKGDAPAKSAPPEESHESQPESQSTSLTVVTEVLPPDGKSETGFRFDAEVAPHNRYHRNAMLSVAQAACWIVLCGAELARQKKESGHGRWEEWVEAHCEYNIRTAQKYMAVADAVKNKALKDAKTNPDSFLALLDKSPAELGDAEQLTLLKSVHKLTDGQTIQELYEEYGVTKKAQGSGALGGDTRIPCPHCQKLVKANAAQCPHCHGEITPYDPNAPVEIARDLLLNPLREIARLWDQKEGSAPLWTCLPHVEMQEIDAILLDLRNDLKEALKGARKQP